MSIQEFSEYKKGRREGGGEREDDIMESRNEGKEGGVREGRKER